MKRDERLVRLSRDHHHALVFCLRIERDLAHADAEGISRLYADLIGFWAAGLLPHFRAENECLLARLIGHLDHGHESISRLHKDHLDIEALAIRISETSDIEERRSALAAFGARLRSHVRWEEGMLFPLTEGTLTQAEMDRLGYDLAERLPAEVVFPLQ